MVAILNEKRTNEAPPTRPGRATPAHGAPARAEANRQSRYLAAYVKPTLAQEAEYPERAKLLLILGGFLMLLWVIGVLIYYSLRDRR